MKRDDFHLKGIITLCGSTKFKKEFNAVNYVLTLKDYIVLSVGSFLHSDNNLEIKQDIIEHKKQLDKLHLDKIDLSDAVFIIDVNRYLGDSTKNEIKYAESKGKKFYWFSREAFADGNTLFNVDDVDTIWKLVDGKS